MTEIRYPKKSEAARKRAIAIKEKYGEDFLREAGRKGGKMNKGKAVGFAADPDRAREAGSLGGKTSMGKYGDDWLNKLSVAKRKEKQSGD